jgi:hypothetical protein
MAKIVDLNHKWATAIGRVFVAFGGIEYTSFKCLENIPKDNILQSTKNLPLGKRIDLLQEILTTHDNLVTAELISNFREIKKLSEHRNLIAHNPLVLDLYSSGDDDDLCLKEKIMSLKKPDKHMYFNELEKLAMDSEMLSSNFLKSALSFFRYLDENNA